MNQLLCIAIHDVAPATWFACRKLTYLVQSLDVDSMTLLIVPDYHRRGRIDRDPLFIREIDELVDNGAETVLHGYYHADEAAPPRTVAQFYTRRIYTAGEGEFAALGEDEAAGRIDSGQRLMARVGWNVRGFAAPAWLASPGARQALRRSSLGYFSTRRALVGLPGCEELPAPTITASARSGWRRTASRSWISALLPLTRSSAILRVGLHPADADDPSLMAARRRVLGELLSTRTPLTKSDAMRRFS